MKGRVMDTPKEEAETKESGQRMRQGGGAGGDWPGTLTSLK